MKLFLSILFFVSVLPVFAQQDTLVKQDMSHVELRKFDKEQIQEYKEMKWFDYEEPAKPVNSFWDWLWRKVLRFLSKIFSNRGAAPYWRNGIAIAVLLAVAYVLFRKYISGMLQIDVSGDVDFQEVSDDIYANDLDKLLEKAISEQAYRHAVRILFLKHVRQLSDKQYIDWKLNKTNHQYWHEIQQENILAKFKDLTLLYEYVWYGEFQVDAVRFGEIRTDFNTADKMLG